MGESKLRVLVLASALAFLWACDARPLPARASDKPAAPIELSLAPRPLGNGLVEVTLSARPTRDLDSLVLRLGERERRLPAVRAGVVETLVVLVRGPVDVVGSAETAVGGQVRRRAAVLGRAEKLVQPRRVITLPGGEQVAEVLP